jgi:hypothetical protein
VVVAWGSPKTNEFAYIKRSVFPVENGRKAASVISTLPILIYGFRKPI